MKIEAIDLSVGYIKEHEILHIPHVLINDSDLITIIKGNNGSGKTTFIRALTKALPHCLGQVYFDNILMNQSNRTTVLRKLGFGLTTSLAYSNMNLRQNVTLFNSIYDSKYTSLFEELVSKLRIEALVDKQISTLSLGQKKLVDLILALNHSPELVFLDEPTANLDASAIDLVLSTLQDYSSSKHMQFVIATNDVIVFHDYVAKEISIRDGKIF